MELTAWMIFLTSMCVVCVRSGPLNMKTWLKLGSEKVFSSMPTPTPEGKKQFGTSNQPSPTTFSESQMTKIENPNAIADKDTTMTNSKHSTSARLNSLVRSETARPTNFWKILSGLNFKEQNFERSFYTKINTTDIPISYQEFTPSSLNGLPLTTREYMYQTTSPIPNPLHAKHLQKTLQYSAHKIDKRDTHINTSDVNTSANDHPDWILLSSISSLDNQMNENIKNRTPLPKAVSATKTGFITTTNHSMPMHSSPTIPHKNQDFNIYSTSRFSYIGNSYSTFFPPYINDTYTTFIFFSFSENVSTNHLPPFLKDNKGFCPDYESCQDRCGTVNVKFSLSKFPCHCDDRCWFYGDCCLDYYPTCLGVNIMDTSLAILNATLKRFDIYSDVFRYQQVFKWSQLSSCQKTEWKGGFEQVQMVTKCSQDAYSKTRFNWVYKLLNQPTTEESELFIGLDQETITAQCESLSQNGDQPKHPLSEMHVTLDLDKSIHFYNVFCAICNDILPSQVVEWESKLKCTSRGMEKDSFLQIFNGSVQEAISEHSCVTSNIVDLDLIKVRPCFPHGSHWTDTYKEPLFGDNEFESSKSNNKNVSLNNEETQEPTAKDFLSKLCHRYQYPFMDLYSLAEYKNPHCQLLSESIIYPSHIALMKISTDIYWHMKFICRNLLCDCLYYESKFTIMPTTPSINSSIPDDNKDDLPPLKIASFRILFDFKSHIGTAKIWDETIIIQSKSCPTNQVYIPFYQSCSNIICLPGMYLREGKCVTPENCLASDNSKIKNCVKESVTSPTLEEDSLPFPDGSEALRLKIVFNYLLSPEGQNQGIGREGGDGSDNNKGTMDIMTNNDQKFNEVSSINLEAPTHNIVDEKENSFGRHNEDLIKSNEGNIWDSFPPLLSLENMKSIWTSHMMAKGTTNNKEVQAKHAENLMIDMQTMILSNIRNQFENTVQKRENVFCSHLSNFNCWEVFSVPEETRASLPTHSSNITEPESTTTVHKPTTVATHRQIQDLARTLSDETDVKNFSNQWLDKTWVNLSGHWFGEKDKNQSDEINEDVENISGTIINLENKETVDYISTSTMRPQPGYGSNGKTSKKSVITTHINDTSGISHSCAGKTQGYGKTGILEQTACMSMVFIFRDSETTNKFIKAMNNLISSLLLAAYDSNFDLSQVVISNTVNNIKKQQQPVNLNLNAMENSAELKNGKSTKAGGNDQLCPSGRTVKSQKVSVNWNNNAFEVKNFNKSQLALDKFQFDLEMSVDHLSGLVKYNEANISWCVDEVANLNCESMNFLSFNDSQFIEVKGFLIISDNAHNLIDKLDSKKRNMTLKDLIQNITYNDQNNMAIFEKGSYVRTRNGVIVCSNFSSTFEEVNVRWVSRIVLYQFTPSSRTEKIATLIASLILIGCLLIVLAVYSIVSELRNVPGKIVMSLSAALLFAQLLFLFCLYPKKLLCEIYSLFHHAAWLASFVWLAFMSVDLAFTLHFQFRDERSRDEKFRIISAFCWGLPVLIATVCFMLDKTDIVNIGYGKNGICWIGNLSALLAVFEIPIFFTLILTLVSAIIVIRAIRRSANFRRKNVSVHKKNGTYLILCSNLSLLMGFNWVFYFMAISVESNYLWIAHILANGSEGLYICLCYVARRPLLSKLRTIWRQWQSPLFSRSHLCRSKSETSKHLQISAPSFNNPCPTTPNQYRSYLPPESPTNRPEHPPGLLPTIST